MNRRRLTYALSLVISLSDGLLRSLKTIPLLYVCRAVLDSPAGFKAGIERHAAVDEQRRAGDIIRFIRRQPNSGPSHVFGFADALVRDKLHQLGVSLGCIPCRG